MSLGPNNDHVLPKDLLSGEVSRILKLTNFQKKDIKERIELDHRRRLMEDKANDIHFYDTLISEGLSESFARPRKLLVKQKEKLNELNTKEKETSVQGKRLLKESTQASNSSSLVSKRSASESNLRWRNQSDITENKFQLSEIYKLMDFEKEIESKQSTPSIIPKINNEKAVSHDTEIEIIRNLDNWTLKNKFNKTILESKSNQLRKLGTNEMERMLESSPIKKKPRHQKTMSDFGVIEIQKSTQDIELPGLVKMTSESPTNKRRGSLMRMEDRINKRKEKEKNLAEMENMRKSIRQSLNLDKMNNYQEEMKLKLLIAKKQQEERDEQRKHNLATIKQHIQAFLEIVFEDPNYPPLLERVAYIERQSSEILDRVMRKIKDLTALIENKQYMARNMRRDNKLLGDKIIKLKIEKGAVKKLINEQGVKQNELRPKNLSVFTFSNEDKDSSALNETKRIRSQTSSVLTANINRSLMAISQANLNEERELNLKNLNSQEKEYKEIIEFNKLKVKQMEDIFQHDKLELKNYCKIHKEFLFILLKDGRDVRRKGLSWIIRIIWSLGEPIYEQSLPDFLDQKAKDFLIAKSKLENNMEELLTLQRISLDIYKHSKTSNMKNTESFFNTSSVKLSSDKYTESNLDEPSSHDGLFFSSGNPEAENYLYFTNKNIIQEMNKSKLSVNDIYISELRAKMKKTIYPTREETEQDSVKDLGISEGRSEAFQTNNENLKLFEDGKQINNYPDRDSFLKEYEALQRKIENLQKSYHKLYQDEVERMIKEFDYKGYARRHKTNCAAVFSALFGVKNANREILRYGMSGK